MDRMTTKEAVSSLCRQADGNRVRSELPRVPFPDIYAKDAEQLYVASRLLAALAEEVRAGRAYDDHCEGDLAAFDPEKERELYSAVTEARAATDALTGEFEEKA